MARKSGTSCIERLSTCAVFLPVAVSNGTTAILCSTTHNHSCSGHSVCFRLNTSALLFNAFILFKNITEKPGDATGDFTALICFPLTICLTPIFVFFLWHVFLSSGGKVLICIPLTICLTLSGIPFRRVLTVPGNLSTQLRIENCMPNLMTIVSMDGF